MGVVLAGSTGCDYSGEYEPQMPPPVYEEMDGELGVLSFRWECVDDTDPTCGTGDFPEAIAVGSRFELVFDRDQRAEHDIDLVSASPDRLSGSRLFTAHEAGDVTVVAKDGPSLLDFMELRLEAIDRLDMTTIPDEDEVCEWSCEPLQQRVRGPRGGSSRSSSMTSFRSGSRWSSSSRRRTENG